MATYPVFPRSAFEAWCQAHAGVFAAQAKQIGLPGPQAALFADRLAALKAAELAQALAMQAARMATQQVRQAYRDMRATAGDTVRLIRAFAEAGPDPSAVYQAAMIPVPQAGSPVPPPDRPHGLRVTLDATSGALTLRWKATNPPNGGGTTYLVRRRLPGEAGWTFIGVAGRKRFVDGTIPGGVASVEYVVQGHRADTAGPPSPIFTVNFGVSPAGGRVATVAAALPAEGLALPGGTVAMPGAAGAGRAAAMALGR